jgi:hypothetical protein
MLDASAKVDCQNRSSLLGRCGASMTLAVRNEDYYEMLGNHP